MRLSQFFYTILTILGFTIFSFGQEASYKLPDSLKSKSLDELIQYNWRWNDDKITQFVITKAKKREHWVTLADAYLQMFYYRKAEQALFYLDSVIDLKDRFQNKVHPAQAYFWKGKYFFNTRDFQKSSDNFVEAYKYASQNNNQEIIYFSKHSLATLKEEIGDIKEALDIHKQNLEYINVYPKTTITEKDQLRTFFSIIRSHNRLKEVDSAYHYLDIAIPKAIRSEEDTDIEYNDLVLASAETHIISENHKQSVDSLLKVKPYYEAVNEPTALSETNYFLAWNYLKNNKEREAIPLLKSVDTLFQKNNDVRAKVRESYILLKEYYNEKEDYKNQLIYTDKLIALQDTIHQN